MSQHNSLWQTDPRAYAANGGNGSRGWGDLTKGTVPVVLAVTMALAIGWGALQAGILWAQSMARLEGIEQSQKATDSRLTRMETTLSELARRTGWVGEVRRTP